MGKRLTTEEWIKKARDVHGDKYDYSLVQYVDSKTKIKIICNTHNTTFVITPNSHLRNHGCPTCSYKKRKEQIQLRNAEMFAKKGICTHGDLYDYTLVKYVSNRTEVKILCSVHGEFLQTPQSHLRKDKRVGCPKCSGSKFDTLAFINKAIQAHGTRYNYSKSKYTLSTVEVDIICLVHGVFRQRPDSHINAKKGCPKCAGLNKSTEEWIEEVNKTHKNKYDYSLVSYRYQKDILKIICPIHGIFEQRASDHNAGCGCQKCGLLKTSGENSYFYKDGKSKEHKKERATPENYIWTKGVKQRKIECDCCNELFTEYNVAHAHHLNSWVDHPSERFDVSNGVAICEECHWEFHETYGYGYNTREQYHQFKQIKQIEI